MAGDNRKEIELALQGGGAHGAFTWGKSPEDAVANSLALEKCAKMAWGARLLNPETPSFPDYLLRKHYRRKHGPDAYYGQKTGETK